MFITQSSPLANLGEWFSRDNPTDSPRHPICCCLSHITTQSEQHFLAQSGFNKFVQFPPFLAPISVNSFVTSSPVFGPVWPDSTNNALAAVIISPSVAPPNGGANLDSPISTTFGRIYISPLNPTSHSSAAH